MKKIIYALLFTLTMAATASAQMYVLQDSGTTPEVVGSNNEFVVSGDISEDTFWGAPTIGFTQAGTVTFEVLGHESGYYNSFYVANSIINYTESVSYLVNNFAAPIGLGSISVLANTLASDWFFTNNRSNNPSVTVNHTSKEFGVFFNGGLQSVVGDQFFMNSMILAFDDNGAGIDDNHDDLLIRATFVSAVPEPSTWLMMIIGFGIVAASAKRTSKRQLV